jgi:hypothetical protein
LDVVGGELAEMAKRPDRFGISLHRRVDRSELNPRTWPERILGYDLLEKRHRRREVPVSDRVFGTTVHGIGVARGGDPANAHPVGEELLWAGGRLRAINRQQSRIAGRVCVSLITLPGVGARKCTQVERERPPGLSSLGLER